MHILIIPSWYKSADEPMLGSFFEEQARALIKLGHQAGILYPDYHPPSALFSRMTKLPPYVNDNGLHTYALNVRTFLPKMRMANYTVHGMAANKLFKKYVAKHGMPDVLHAHSCNHAGIAAAYISKKHNLPLVITEHLTTLVSHSIVHDTDFKITRNLFKNADKSLAVSQVFKDNLVSALHLHPHYFDVLHNMVNDLFFDNIQIKKYNANEPFILFTNSFLHQRKNHKLLFNALKILVSRGINVHLHVGGYGSEEQTLKNYVNQLQLQNNIHFTGMLQRHEVKQQIDACHAFVLASNYETFGVVLIEALAGGRPVITTDSKGPRDIVTSHNGLLLTDYTPETFAAAIAQLMQNYNRYNQQEISKQCHQQFSQQTIAGKLTGIYQTAINKRIHFKTQPELKNLLLTFDFKPALNSAATDIANTFNTTIQKLLPLLNKHQINAMFFIDVVYLLHLKKLQTTDANATLEHITSLLQKLTANGNSVLPLYNYNWQHVSFDRDKNIANNNIDSQYLNDGISLLKDLLPACKIDGIRFTNAALFMQPDIKEILLAHDIKNNFSVVDDLKSNTKVEPVAMPEKFIYRFETDFYVDCFNGRLTQFNATLQPISTPKNITHKLEQRFSFSGLSQTNNQINVFNGNKILSVNKLNPINLDLFKMHLAQNYFQYFISDLVQISDTSWHCFDSYLQHAITTYAIESNYINMLQYY